MSPDPKLDLSQIEAALLAAVSEAKDEAAEFQKRAAANAAPGIPPPGLTEPLLHKFARQALDGQREAILLGATLAVVEALGGVKPAKVTGARVVAPLGVAGP